MFPKESVLGLVLLNLLNDLDDGTEHILSKLVDDSKLGGVTDTPRGCATIQ